VLAIVAIALGMVIGLAVGGSVVALRAFRMRFEIPIIILFLAQGLARGRIFEGAMPAAIGVWSCTSAILVVLLVFNRSIRGLLICALGVLLNLEASLLNLGMPVAYHGATWSESAGLGRAIVASGGLYRAIDASTIWSWAGDVIPFSIGGQTVVLSVGDVLLIVGVLVAVVGIMTTPDGGAKSEIGGRL
jgi:Family of unknown function (DUF5317)